MAELVRLKPDFVFTIATRGSGESERVPEGYVDQWEKLRASDISVVAIRDTPWLRFDVPECVATKGPSAPQCARSRAEMLAKENPVFRLTDPPSNVRFIDMSDYFCTATACPPVIGNILVYRDKHHITATYARTVAPYLERELPLGKADESSFRKVMAAP